MLRFSYNLLKKNLEFKESPEKLAELLTMHLAETKVNYYQKRPILEIDLLPNRVSDCSGHFGLLKEIAAILGKNFTFPVVKVKENKQMPLVKDWVEVKIEDISCRRYEMKAIWWLKVKESPSWLKRILKECGLRPINNVVDAVNYTMLLTGQPLHVFDFQKVAFNNKKPPKKEIIIRLARKRERILTLDNRFYDLKDNQLLITDSEKILALAGIKGGKFAEVDKETKMVLIESANFSPEIIRKTSQELNLKTDASYRFEHNLSRDLTDYSLDLATNLIQKLAGGRILRGKIDKEIVKSPRKEIFISFNAFNNFAGFKISQKLIKRNLSLLGFNFKQKKNGILVLISSLRTDIFVKEDVIGEVLRLIGFNSILSKPPKAELIFKKEDEKWLIRNKLKDIIKSFNLYETYNYSFVSKKEVESILNNRKNCIIEVLNPVSELFAFLRPTFALNFLKNIKDNSRFEDKFGLFEINNIYFKENNNLKEELVFAGVIFAAKEKNLLFEAKGIIESTFSRLKIENGKYSFKNFSKNNKYSAILEKGGEIILEKEKIGVVGYFKNELLKKYDIDGQVAFWEIKVQSLKKFILKDVVFSPLLKYPLIKRDLSLIVKEDVSIAKVISTIKSLPLKYLKEIDLFDVYTGENIGKEEKSLAFHLTFYSLKKTLTSEEVDREMEKIIRKLKTINAVIR